LTEEEFAKIINLGLAHDIWITIEVVHEELTS
jgi:hypothetical protein